MKWRYGCLAVLLVVLLPPFVIGLSFYYPSLLHLSAPHYTHHYRLTLEVEADGVVHTGSGVIEVVWRYRGTWGTPNLYDAWYDTVRGQAVAVDLGRRGLLLARLQDEGYFGGAPIEKIGQIVIGGAIAGTPPPADVANHVEDWLLDRAARRALGQLEGRRLAIPPNVMPSLVWLPEARDPRSAVPVPNADSLDTLVANARLRGAWIELTDDRVTTDLFARLPWLAQRYQSEKSSGRSELRGVLGLPAWTLTRQIEP